jgi:hypothetical protein
MGMTPRRTGQTRRFVALAPFLFANDRALNFYSHIVQCAKNHEPNWEPARHIVARGLLCERSCAEFAAKRSQIESIEDFLSALGTRAAFTKRFG